MKFFAVALLFAALGAAGAPTKVTVQPSNTSFKEALEACSPQALAALTMTLGHVRISEAVNVNSDIDDTSPSSQTITLSSGSKTATVTVNAHANTVAAKHVKLASRDRVACVAPD